MINNELKDRLEQTFHTCATHVKRMEFAQSRVQSFLPLNREIYYDLNDETIGFMDQYIFRFSKLQDVMGNRLFPLTLEALAEPVAEMAFIDILNRLEKLRVLDSAYDWIELRKIRNDIVHEYPSSLEERIEGLNYIFNKPEELKQIIQKCQAILGPHK
jgi:hypothetical protein